MRFLHTGDWHVGKSLRGERRAEEHRAVVSEIAGRERKVEVVLVAGDLFDTASPGPEAEEIVFHALLDLAHLRTGRRHRETTTIPGGSRRSSP